VSGIFEKVLSGVDGSLSWLQLNLLGCASLVQQYTLGNEATINKIWSEIYSKGTFNDMKSKTFKKM
jgi:hypothetical protein